jgi:chromosome segregation ATPase
MRSIYHMDVENLDELQSARLAKLEERTKNALCRLDRLEKLTDAVHTQNEQIARLVVSLDTLTRALEKQEERLAELERIPTKRWTAVVGAIITALASAFVGGAVTVLF